jgi:hypothetical protein
LKSSPAGIAAGRPPARTRAIACVGRRPANGSRVAISIAGISRELFMDGRRMKNPIEIHELAFTSVRMKISTKDTKIHEGFFFMFLRDLRGQTDFQESVRMKI